MQGDAGAARHVGSRLDREAALAVGSPAPAFALPGLAAQYLDLVSDHERGIEADAELADQAHVAPRVAGQLVDKSGGAGAGDRAEIFDQLIMAHADAVIRDGQRAR